MKKNFDAVKMQRDIRRDLSHRYSKHQELEEQDLQKIRSKYGFPEPHCDSIGQMTAKKHGSHRTTFNR